MDIGGAVMWLVLTMVTLVAVRMALNQSLLDINAAVPPLVCVLVAVSLRSAEIHHSLLQAFTRLGVKSCWFATGQPKFHRIPPITNCEY